MSKCHLKVYCLTLTAEAPVFVGSGETIERSDYYYDEQDKFITVYDPVNLFTVIAELGLEDVYENLIMSKGKRDLNIFFDRHPQAKKLADQKALNFKVNGSMINREGKNKTDVRAFMRDGHGRPYIPGSSLKGAVRTALTVGKLLETEKRKYVDQAKNEKPDLWKLNNIIDKENGIRNLIKGISFSDSEPLSNDDIILAAKIDHGISGGQNQLNVARECLRPGTTITFKMTLDQSVSKQVDVSSIKASIEKAWNYYNQMYLSKFKLPEQSAEIPEKPLLVLGGGSGYFSKNVVYPALGYEQALEEVSRYMKKEFAKGYHEDDQMHGISPHMLKLTRFQNKYYHFGLCSFVIQEEQP